MKIGGTQILALLGMIITLACTRDDVQVEVVSPLSLNYDAMCQRDSIVFTADCEWSVESGCEWLTVENDSGYGDGTVSLYIQQNDGENNRTGFVTLHFMGGEDVTIPVCQDASNLNSYSVLVNLPMTYGVGWGYDYSVDHADIDGVRGQIIDEAKLDKITNRKSIISEPYTSTYTECCSEQSASQLIEKMSGKLTAGVDIKIASAKVNGTFSKQTSENKERLYVWYRDMRSVKQAHINADIFDVAEHCLTHDFIAAIESVKKGGSVNDLIKKYGTHLIWNSTLGGKFDWYFAVSQQIKESAEKIVATITVKILFWKKTATSVEEKIWQEVKKDFIGSFEVTGGGNKGKALNDALQVSANRGEPISDPDLITKWQDCFISATSANDNELTMIDFEVYPIWEIVECIDGNTAEKVRNYIVNEYLK